MKTLIISIALAAALFGNQAQADKSMPHARKPFDSAAAKQSAFGIAGDPAKVTRTIVIEARDTLRFAPSAIDVKQGETIRFIVKNPARLMHEMVIGTMKELKEHSETMKKFPGMEHDAPYMAHVPPGKTQEIVWTFNRPGEFYFACLVAGHFEGGMVGKITVRP